MVRLHHYDRIPLTLIFLFSDILSELLHTTSEAAPKDGPGPTTSDSPKHPSSPAAFSIEGSLHTSGADDPGANQYPVSSDLANATCPSSAHSTFTQSGSVPQIPAGSDYGQQVEFAQPALPSHLNPLGLSQASVQSAFSTFQQPHSQGQSHNQIQPNLTLQPDAHGRPDMDGNQSGAGYAPMGSLGPLGYNESGSLLLPTSQFGLYGTPTQHFMTGDHPDLGVPDFALVNDTLSMWSSIPPTFA